ncbi:MAG: hypothetical protein IJ549_05155 [Prevotella sp.]|nr:hypothetical protein [Prevotella sp.]MBQ8702132.1 hypothetical protein [Prevotella sp.]MBQ9650856.1 hypothetical protein [Prevotella sp.]
MLEEPEYRRHRQEEEEEQQKDRFFIIRQILNICFMIGAVVGVLLYILGSKSLGMYVVLIAMVIKFSESALRMMNIRK